MAAASISASAARCNTPMWRIITAAGLAIAATPAAASPRWVVEAQDPAAHVTRHHGVIDIDTAQGLTLWYARKLTGPLTIAFDAMAVSNGGPNDKVSDLNAFWMARNADGASPVGRRSGRFEEYDTLRMYYVGIGGNRNTTTRLRRYVGQPGIRPLLPEHDRMDAPAMLRPNVWTRITLTADHHHITVTRDGTLLFTLDDAAPYTSGWFALRTTWSHLRLRNIAIHSAKDHP
jgi:hypothetical protein